MKLDVKTKSASGVVSFKSLLFSIFFSSYVLIVKRGTFQMLLRIL